MRRRGIYRIRARSTREESTRRGRR